MDGSSRCQRQLRAMLRKNWLLKIRHPFATATEILLPTIVMLLLIGVRTRVDTQIHPVQSYIKKGMFVEIGKSEIAPSFDSILELLAANDEHIAFAPDNKATRTFLDVISLKFPLLKVVSKVYKNEPDLEAYIRSGVYGVQDHAKNISNPKIKGAVVFHEQGPQLYDYSIRLNHTWAVSGFPDVKTIMDVNGPYLDDLELGMNIIPTLQYGFSGFLTLQQMLDSAIILLTQRNVIAEEIRETISFHPAREFSGLNFSWTQFIPENIRIAPFPTHEYTDDEFQSIVKKVMGVLYLLGFLYPISRLISCAVYEKEQKIKEGLYMMGLQDEIFYLAWFITYSIQFALSSAISTLCTMSSLFMYSDKSLVFVYFFFFGLSAVMLAFLISTFFSRAKTAVAVGTLSFLGAFLPYYTVNDPVIPMVWKILASILSPTAFALGTVNFADYERAHVGLRWSNMWQASSGVNFLACLFMMMLDALLYCLIGLYFDKVLPRENGIRYPWNFLFAKYYGGREGIFYQRSKKGEVNDKKLDNEVSYSGKGSLEPVIETISLEMKQQELDGRCIQIRNLCKVYSSKKGRCSAVNSLQLTLYENQILAILGHNGAGKSTTISMLVGLLTPTSGDAVIFGKNIRTDMDEIRKTLGVCPQNDILFPELTVREHMEIFAILKGVEDDQLEQKVAEMIDEVGLANKTNTSVDCLSGGMKRKLSLGIALIGNSKVVILDEPTSGMDPYSMRSTWQLIKKKKKGRIILLTTHSMDEADVLGDRIAIMASGHLRCCGSSLFLKHRYGVGYTLTLSKTAPGASVATDIVHNHVPSADLLSDVGTEVSFRLPLTSSSSFENMFREIESCIRRTAMISDDSCNHNEDMNGIQSYGISVTTLEEVFLRVSGQHLDERDGGDSHEIISGTDNGTSGSSSATKIKPSDSKISCEVYLMLLGRICAAIGGAFSLMLTTIFSFIPSLALMFCGCGIVTKSTFWKHSKALLIKRALSARRDRKTIFFQLFIPAIFLLTGLLFLKLKSHPDQDSVTLTTSYFNPLLTGGGGGGPIPFNLSLPIAKKVASHIKGGWIQEEKLRAFKFPNPEETLIEAIQAAGPQLGPALLSMSEYLITSLNESYQSRYGAVLMDEQNDDGSMGFTVLHNSSCQHAAPTYINLVNSALLRLATGNDNMTIKIRNHPLPMTMSQHSQHHDLDAFSAAIIVNIAFSFIPASFAVAVVKEREVKAKHQQLISGVSTLSYWISTYIWDFVSFLFPTTLAFALFFVFGLEQFIGYGCFLATLILFMEYGLAIAASTYCLTFFFSDHTVAQNVVLLVHFFTGLVLMLISFVMELIEATRRANSLFKNFFRLSPGFCFADGLASLALRRQRLKLGSGGDSLDWNIAGASIFYLAIESILYFILALVLELFPYNKFKLVTIRDWWTGYIHPKSEISDSAQPLLGSSENITVSIGDEDVDVRAERHRVLSGCANNALISLCNLRKVYPAGRGHSKKVAVQSLTFSVNAGECFGFLGTNGAGKTTTLSMLTGEECPTDGTAYIFGKDMRMYPKAARHHIGYCPQFDALLEFLTVREHLQLYARIKAVPDAILEAVVNQKLLEFDLLKHAEKLSSSLSGGNKRKLSVAIAMIGDPPIVILDEPSTGMDPIAKRFMWEVISRLSTRRGKTAVILTTHSMNEAQALCTRIGIMVSGQLRCIGSPQHLKTRYGNHLELEVKPSETSSTELDNLCKRIQEALFDFPSHKGGILNDLEICIGGSYTVLSDNITEINLTKEMITLIARLFGDKEAIQNLVSSAPVVDGIFGERLSEQLVREGGIPLRIFSEWWLAKEKFLRIESFIISSFPGATCHGCNGLSIKYQLPYGESSSLADIFGHLEHNRENLGIEEYSISQSTLETIFNHFAAKQHLDN